MQLAQHIYRVLNRKHGISATPAAIEYLCEIFGGHDADRQVITDSLDFIASEFAHLQGSPFNTESGSLLEKNAVENILMSIMEQKQLKQTVRMMDQHLSVDLSVEEVGQLLMVLDTFDLPKYRYHPDEKEFLTCPVEPNLLAQPLAKIGAYRDRYELIKQRILRHESFRPQLLGDERSCFQMTPIIHLKGKKPGRYLLFGMLTSMEEGKIHLEDPDCFIELVFDQQVERFM